MIIWINGPYCAGKTTIAKALVQLWPQSLLYDPEVVGMSVRDLVRPIERSQDYQELRIFPPAVVFFAQQLQQQYGKSLLIMPLGVWDEQRHAAILTGLQQIDPQVQHYCLTATRQTIIHRLASRGDSPQALLWIDDRLDACLAALQAPVFDHKITTDQRTPREIAHEIQADIEEQREQ
jgi:hypothetical protein